MYLLDTVVISELRKTSPNKNVLAWVETCKENELFLSVVTLGEIQRGARLQLCKNPEFSQKLSLWLEKLIKIFDKRILPITNEIAIEWGNISAEIGNSGADNFIAATAKIHGLAVVTRNIRHFEAAGVPVENPWI